MLCRFFIAGMVMAEDTVKVNLLNVLKVFVFMRRACNNFPFQRGTKQHSPRRCRNG